jgi:hypothetical protein
LDPQNQIGRISTRPARQIVTTGIEDNYCATIANVPWYGCITVQM